MQEMKEKKIIMLYNSLGIALEQKIQHGGI